MFWLFVKIKDILNFKISLSFYNFYYKFITYYVKLYTFLSKTN